MHSGVFMPPSACIDEGKEAVCSPVVLSMVLCVRLAGCGHFSFLMPDPPQTLPQPRFAAFIFGISGMPEV